MSIASKLKTSQLRIIRHRFYAMTCPCEIVVPVSFAHLIEPMLRLLNFYVKKYSRFDRKSLLSAINRSAGKKEGCAIDGETCSLLEFVDRAYQASSGDFDPSVKQLVELWSFKRAKVPTEKEIELAQKYSGWKHIRWSKHERRIWLPEGFSLDFGGFVKEYIADKIVVLARNKGCHRGFVNLGGDVAVIDEGVSTLSWRIGIANPQQPSLPSAMIDIDRGAIATSGSYERQFTQQGKCFSHIISPRTGYPVEQKYQSISVYHSSCLMSGFLATVAMIRQQEAIEWLQSANAKYFMQTCA